EGLDLGEEAFDLAAIDLVDAAEVDAVPAVAGFDGAGELGGVVGVGLLDDAAACAAACADAPRDRDGHGGADDDRQHAERQEEGRIERVHRPSPGIAAQPGRPAAFRDFNYGRFSTFVSMALARKGVAAAVAWCAAPVLGV